MMLRMRSHDPEAPRTYILDFFRDKKDGCALTARINDNRFYIVVDPAKLKSKGDDSVYKEYYRRLKAVKAKDESTQDDGGNASNSSSEDSGVDVTVDQTQAEAETDLQNHILSCFGDETAKLGCGKSKSLTLEEWYNAPIHYFGVITRNGTMIPKRLEEGADYKEQVDDLFPTLPLPKSLRDLKIPHTSPSDYKVLETADDPPPIHPCLVQSTKDKKKYFFKPVDPTQPQPARREIKSHHSIQSKSLHKQIKVPLLHALVFVPNSTTHIMGLLLTPIPDPTPLTKLLDSEVDESKRRKWAKESLRIVQTLHDAKLIWGDAKADNFMIDKNDDLWIIDFGGSYTDGWVDPDNMETTEGDNEGTEKIVNALKDPENAIFNMEEVEEEKKRQEKERRFLNAESGGGKRKRDGDEDEERKDWEDNSKGDKENEGPVMKASKTKEFN